MDIRPLPVEEPAVSRFTEELWLPYHRELEATVDAHALADDLDEAEIVAEEVEFRLDRLTDDDYRAWVAVDAEPADDAGIADITGDFAGFVTTERSGSPPVFDYPDRLVVGDIYVRKPYRGTGIARELVDRAAERARELGCSELALDVDADNERALAFYEKLGFEPYRHHLTVAVEEL